VTDPEVVSSATQSPRPRVTVLICTLNEAESLPHVLPKVPEWVDEVLLVDGRSTDGTVETALRLRSDIRVAYQPGRGKGDALRYGAQQATGDIVITLDADGDTNPEDLSLFVKALLRGYDIAKGSRLSRGKPPRMAFHRWIGNKILAFTFNILYGTHYSDICSGYNGFWRDALLTLVNAPCDGFELEQYMLARAHKTGTRVVEVPHGSLGRLAGSSKTEDLKQGFKDWLMIIKERFCA
jgi:glycosyltransferase involved in cell wall biosynthesis